MNEPLNNSGSRISFSGKSHNNHPQWYNTPLRLTKAQKHNPLPIITDFFECYHLNEARNILWNWLVEVISSAHSISDDPHERNNHIFFYEKIEAVVEASFIMNRTAQKRLRKQSRKKLSKKVKVEKASAVKQAFNQHVTDHNTDIENICAGTVLNKPEELIEIVKANPLYVIRQISKDESYDFLRDQLRDWLQIALTADTPIYEEGEQRGQLLSFFEYLQMLLEALSIINNQPTAQTNPINNNTENDKVESTGNIKIALLSREQIANPKQVLNDLFNKYPIVYIRRELNDLLEAGLTFTGTYPENMNELQVLYTYRNISCLIEAANQILKTR